MIDPELRDIIVAELAEGEELLWAEKTKQEMREAWASAQVKTDQNSFIILVASAAVLLGLCYSFELWRNDPRIAFLILLLILVSLLSFGAILNPDKKKSAYLAQREIGGYALSNFRFFVFNLSFSITERCDAQNLKSARPFRQMPRLSWKTTNLLLAPVGNNWLKSSELYFLEDFAASETYINTQIRRISS